MVSYLEPVATTLGDSRVSASYGPSLLFHCVTKRIHSEEALTETEQLQYDLCLLKNANNT